MWYTIGQAWFRYSSLWIFYLLLLILNIRKVFKVLRRLMLKSILFPIVLGDARCEILFPSMLEKMNVMKKDLQSLIVLHVHSCTHWLMPRNPPAHLGSYTRALLVS
jgi:hypothetical protein